MNVVGVLVLYVSQFVIALVVQNVGAVAFLGIEKNI